MREAEMRWVSAFRIAFRPTCAVLALAACGGDPPRETEASLDPDSVAIDTAAIAPEVPEPEPLPTLPGEGEPRVYRLRLVNPLAFDALVFASASAARVVLDTVPAGDSIHVDLRLRGDAVALEAEAEGGRPISSGSLDLSSSDVNRWVIVDPSGPPD